MSERPSGPGGIPRDRERRQVRYLALASGAILVAVSAMRIGEPELAHRVNVRWAPGVSADERISLERRFSLALPSHDEGSTWTYDLGDPSQATIFGLLRHPAVEDTHGINRQAGVVERDAPLGTIRLGSYPLGAWTASEPVTWLGLCSGWATFLSVAWLVINRDSAKRGKNPSTPASTRFSDRSALESMSSPNRAGLSH